MRIKLILLMLCVIFAGCRNEQIAIDNGQSPVDEPVQADVPVQEDEPIEEPEPPPLFTIDFAGSFTEEDLHGRTQIFYDSGCERMQSAIFYSDSDLHDLRFYNYSGKIWDEENFEFIFVIGDFFFEVNHVFTSEYYIEFIPRIPAKNDFAMFSFKDNNGETRYYVLAHNLNPDIDSLVNCREVKHVQYGYN